MSFFQMLWFGDWLVMSSTIIFVLLAATFTEGERYSWTGGSIVVYYLILEFMTELNIFSWVIDNPKDTILYVLIYFGVIGTSWSIIKWFSFLRSIGDVLEEGRRKNSVWDSTKANEILEMEFGYYSNIAIEKLQVKYQVERIGAWIAYWPLSMLGTLCNDPMRRVAVFMVSRMKGIYNRMSEHMLKKAGLNPGWDKKEIL